MGLAMVHSYLTQTFYEFSAFIAIINCECYFAGSEVQLDFFFWKVCQRPRIAS